MKRFIIFVLIGMIELTSLPLDVLAATITSPAKDKNLPISTLTTDTADAPALPFTSHGRDLKSLMPSFINPGSPEISASQIIAAKVRKLKKENYRPNEEIAVTIENGANDSYTTGLIGANGVKVGVETEETVIGDTKTVTLSQPSSFRPGKYKLRISNNSGGVSEQDFTWGVLAINPDKSIYAPQEIADLAIAVLDETGDMVCDAQVELTIKRPDGSFTVPSLGNNELASSSAVPISDSGNASLSTDNGKIRVNPECKSHDFTLNPDYEARYKVGGEGVYQMTLKSQTKNGVYTITDSFEVRGQVPFAVKRVTATRIYPTHAYPVSVEITANQNFEGTVSETIPSVFKISRPGQNIVTDQEKVDEAIAASGSAHTTTIQAPVIAPDNLKALIGYNTINNLAEPTGGKDILGASINPIGMPFSGPFPVSQEFGESLVNDIHDHDLYTKFGMHGHDGIDFAMPEGTPLLAIDDGKVILAGPGDYGTTIIIQHSWGKSYYGHLSGVKVEQNQEVKRGSEIGKSGNTGISTGPHLHFGIKPLKDNPANGYYGKVDPAYYLGMKQSAGQVLASNPIGVLGAKTSNAPSEEILGSPDADVQILTWKISVKKGEKITLGYNYLAPKISPQFYTIGPATFHNTKGEKVFQEIRKWQIAADAMELKMKRGSFTKTISTNCTAPCVQKVAGVGFKPKAVIFEWTAQTTEGFAAGQSTGMGFMTASSSAGLMAERSVNYCGQDNVGTSNTSGRRSDTKVIMVSNTSCSGVAAQADGVSFDSDGFTISWSTNDTSAYVLHYTAIGGADLSNAMASTFTLTTTAGSQTVAEPGFQPDFVMFLGGTTTAMDSESAGGRMSVGYTAGPTKEAAAVLASVDAVTTTDTYRHQRTDVSIALLTSAGAQDGTAELSSFEANGFVLNKTKVPAANIGIFYLALKGGQYDVGSLTQPTTPGEQSTYTGFSPSGVGFASFGTTGQGGIAATGSLALGGASKDTENDWCNDTTGITCTAEGTTTAAPTDWCNDNSGITCTTSWTARKKITFNNGSSAENLTDFPVLVKLNASRIDYNKTKNDGSDIRFVDPSDPSTVLPHEIESWNESGDSFVWVKVPQIDANSTSDSIWMYYNNAAATDGQSVSNVWDSNYKGVWHLKEDPSVAGSGGILDSTSNANNGTDSGSMTSADQVKGKVDGSLDFDGSDDTVAVARHTSLEPTTQFSVSAWVNPAGIASSTNYNIFTKQDWTNKLGFRMALCGFCSLQNELFVGVGNGTLQSEPDTSIALNTVGQWDFVSATYSSGTIKVYRNGVLADTLASGIASISNATALGATIGSHSSAGEYLLGKIDEVRYSSTTRSDDWVEAEYISESDNMNNFGSEIIYSASTTTSSGWSARRKITFNNSASTEDLRDFPVMVKLSSASANIDFDKTQFHGEDIRFVDADDPNTVLPHEIESWNEPGGEAVVWVKVPKIDARSTTDSIWMYYGNPNAPDGQDKTSVWDNDYKAVWHLKENPAGTAPQIMDSTANSFNAASSGMVSGNQVTGKIDGSLDFDGSNDYASTSDTIDDSLTDRVTVSSWFKIDTTAASKTIFRNDNFGGASGFLLRANTNTVRGNIHNGANRTVNSTTILSTGTWYHAAVTYDGATVTLYVNGVSEGTPIATTGNITKTALAGLIGSASTTMNEPMDGGIDELRISSTGRSADWIEAEYLSGNGNLSSYSAEESQAAGGRLYSEGSIWSDDLDNQNVPNATSNMRTTTTKAISLAASMASGNVPTVASAEASLVSFDPTGFTLGWAINEVTVSARQVLYWAAGSTTASQDDYRWYKNANALTPTTALEDENRSAIIPANKPYARLRANISPGGNGMNASSSAFKLQYASSAPESAVAGTTDWCNDVTGVTCTAPNTGELPANITSDWCNDTTGVTCTSDWSSRRKITFNTATQSAALTDFPVLVKLDSKRIDYSKTQDNGEDLRFVDPSDPTVALPHEIESWDENGSSYVWVKVPTLDARSKTDYIWMYYGNSSVSAPATQLGSSAHATGVWDASFRGVWHLRENPGTQCSSTFEVCDSTSNATHGDANGTMNSADQITAKVGTGLDFDGVDDYIDFGRITSLESLGNLTVSAWLKRSTVGKNVYVGKTKTGFTDNSGVELVSDGTASFDASPVGVSRYGSVSESDTDWHYLTMQFDGSKTGNTNILNGYIDGIKQNLLYNNAYAAPPVTTSTDTSSWMIAKQLGQFSSGTYDEIRISTTTRSTDWVVTDYLSQTDTLNTYGTEINYDQNQRSSSGWEFRKKITFNNASASAALTDFPVLVKLDASKIDYNKTQDDGSDIRFVDPNDNSTVLPHEIESWNENGTSYVWVKVPQIDAGSTSDFIWMYYGNPGVSDGQAATSVWDGNYKAIYHMNNDPSTVNCTTNKEICDSTTNANNGDSNGTMTSGDLVTGEVSKSIDFDGTDDFMQIAHSASLQTATNMSFSAWVNWRGGNTIQTVLEKGASDTSDSYGVHIENGTGKPIFEFNDSGGSIRDYFQTTGTPVSTNSWQLVTVVYDDTNNIIRFYRNGIEVYSTAAAQSLNATYTNNLLLGKQNAGSTNFFNGQIDEVRISGTARSADWIEAEYLTETDKMNSFSDEIPYTIAGASNSGWTDVADIWCNDASGVTCDTSWSNRKRITINNESSTTNLNNFPILVKLDSTRIDYSKTQDDGGDIRFVDSADPTTVLPHEIETWDETGTSYVWVKVPQLDARSPSDSIWMYYGNTSIADGQDATNVWDSSYKGVWHNEEITGPTLTDSTSNSNNASKVSATVPSASTSAKIGGAQFYRGASAADKSTATDQNYFSPTVNDMTVSIWAKVDPGASNDGGGGCSGNGSFFISKKNTNQVEWGLENDANSRICLDMWTLNGVTLHALIDYPMDVDDGQWHNYVMHFDDLVSVKLYIDGTLRATSSSFTSTMGNGTQQVNFGAGGDFGYGANTLDETRISNTLRSADWIQAEYITAIDGMNTFGPEESQTSSVWKFKDNTSVVDRTTLITSVLGTSALANQETYQESNLTSLNPSAIAAGERREWDFSLDGSLASQHKTYYFRLVNADGTPLTNYTRYPALIVGPPLEKLMRHGKWFNYGSSQSFTF